MTVDRLGSPENQRILRAYAFDPANGPLVDEDSVYPNWTVKAGGPIYMRILPLASYAIGSPAWITEMRLLGDRYPPGGVQGPPATLYLNNTLEGGAPSGPALGNNPPDNHNIGFNTVNAGPVQVAEGWFNWEVNPEGNSGRSYLTFSLAQNNPDLQVGDVVRLSYTVRKYSGSGNVVLSYSTNFGVNVTDENTRAVDGVDVTVAYLLEITDAVYDFAVRVGTGVSSNHTAHMLISEPRLTLE